MGAVVRAPGLPGVAFTTRLGGISAPPFDSLNLGYVTGDDPSRVAANRRTVASALGIPETWATGRQVHRAAVLEAGPVHASALRPRPAADAVVTSHAGLPVAVLVADCVPIALVGRRRVGAVHAGWRGLVRGVVERSVGAMGEAVTAWIGPSVASCHYEVGPEVVEQFRRRYPHAPDFSARAGSSLRFDLPAAARWLLEQGGAQVVGDRPPCTACDARFYSHRRDGVTGRHALIVWRSGQAAP